MRLQALERAADAADAAGLTPTAQDVRLAQAEIAKGHDVRSWERLLASPRGRQYAAQITSARQRLARAKRMRDAWFNPSAIPREHEGDGRVKGARRKLLAFLTQRLEKM